ncbi:flavin-nucleotide-binding protein [Natronococcus pandeyae]|uniref:Flavin-nucleotide-binding protein n=1 Tax=Natronococcus pandeyae TaxID=2055836 RepID=A0A8J8TRX9_9EURY|nr:pyridoxamine 5'-phosphate oxidase family protein [Natronococcus pandeyae]TYL37987.1 flavin-nucleotide-binding protein [Natronococcus pandeyae]
MTLDRIEYVYTFGMDDEDIAEAIETNDVGVLSLASDGDAYAIPVSFHYDGSSLYLRLTSDGNSKKLSYVDDTAEACFVLHAVDPPDDSWSIVATGPIRELTAAEQEAFDETAINERFSELRIFDEEIEAVGLTIYELEIEELTGRKTGDHIT